jgi:hypothetical protein
MLVQGDDFPLWRVGNNVEVESEGGDAAFVESLITPFVPLLPVSAEGSRRDMETDENLSNQRNAAT